MDTNNQNSNPLSNQKSGIHRIIESLRQSFTKKPSKKRLLVVSIISLLILGGGVGALQVYGPKAPEPDPVPEVVSTYTPPPPAPTTVASKLTGVQIEPALNERPVTGIMIENSIDARPQAGLYDAGVVFEAIAEGGITRFLALFQESQPDYIGPIRSARPYYVRWAAGFNAGYVHSGGSGEALALIGSIGIRDMDHGKNAGSFDRVSNRYAPHNVYTSMARLDALRSALGHNAGEVDGFERIKPVEIDQNKATTEQAAASPAAEKASSIVFNISSANYNTSYTYDPAINAYPRVMAGQSHTDERSGKQIAPHVIIALEAAYRIHPDGVHSVYDNVGSGAVVVFQNGEVHKGTWSKESDIAPLKFKNPDGTPLLLQSGQTWITAIQAGKYSYTP